MTAIVGVLCRDGLVIGADSSATFAAGTIKTVEQPVEKLTITGNCVITAGTGQFGMLQRFNHIVAEAYTKGKLFAGQTHPIMVAKTLCRDAIADFIFTSAQQGSFGALIGFPVNNEPFLCEFAERDFQPEFKDKNMWYGSMGSGQLITDPFLALIREVFCAAVCRRYRTPRLL
jgi:20S proteasome alpha/beta subunit